MLRLLANYSFADMTYKVKSYVRHCPECLGNTTDRQKPPGLLVSSVSVMLSFLALRFGPGS